MNTKVNQFEIETSGKTKTQMSGMYEEIAKGTSCSWCHAVIPAGGTFALVCEPVHYKRLQSFCLQVGVICSDCGDKTVGAIHKIRHHIFIGLDTGENME